MVITAFKKKCFLGNRQQSADEAFLRRTLVPQHRKQLFLALLKRWHIKITGNNFF
jgi:hypothetical protein